MTGSGRKLMSLMNGRAETPSLIVACLLVAVMVLSSSIVPSPVAATGVEIAVTPDTQTVTPGAAFSISISVRSSVAIRGVQCSVSFDPSLVEYSGWSEGDFLKAWALANGGTTFSHPPVVGSGTLSGVALAIVGGRAGGPSGNGTLFTINFTARSGANGECRFGLSEVIVGDDTGNQVPGVTITGAKAQIGSSLAPRVVTQAATAISATSARLTGILTSMAPASSCTVSFEWGTSTSYGNTTAPEVKSNTGVFGATLTGLLSSTTYHYRAKAVSAHGTGYGESRSFTTTGVPKITATPSVSAVAAGQAFDVVVNIDTPIPSRGAQASLSFDPSLVTCVSIEEGQFFKNYAQANGGSTLVFPVGSIDNNAGRVGTTGVAIMGGGTGGPSGSGSFYIYRMRAKPGVNGIAVFSLSDVSLQDVNSATIAGVAVNNCQVVVGTATLPSVTTLPATAVTGTSATINGNLTNMGSLSSCAVSFDWGNTTSYGNTTAIQQLTAPGAFSANLTGLTPGVTYHFRARALGSVYGADLTFTTPSPSSPPTVVTAAATGVSATGATLNGNLMDLGGASSANCGFEYGTTTSYGSSTTTVVLTATGAFNVVVSGLSPGTTYHYRARAVTSHGTAYGSSMSFTTAPSGSTVDWDVNQDGKVDVLDVVAIGLVWGQTGSPGWIRADVNRDGFISILDVVQVGLNWGWQASSSNLPTVATVAASGVTSTGATLNGNLISLGNATNVTCSFEYGTTTSYGSATTPVNLTAPGAFNATVSGLTPATTYNFRAKAVGGGGTAYGNNLTFTTSAAPGNPVVATGEATDVSRTEARLNGNLTSLGGAASCSVSFEWGTSTSYGNTTPSQEMTATGAFHSTVSGLTAGSTYHFRAKAVSAHGTGYGDNRTFIAVSPPVVTTAAATSVTNTTATLNGNLTDLGGSASVVCSFDYGPTTSYGSTTTTTTMTAPGTFSIPVTGLSPNTTYYFVAKASGNGLTGVGNRLSFTTANSGAPVVVTSPASSISGTGATLNGNLTDLGGASSAVVCFEWGTSVSYGNVTPEQTLTAAGAFSATITGLTQGTTYHFRAKATTSNGTAYGSNQQFVAASQPAVTTSAATSVGATQATLNGNLTSLGGATTATVSFEWGTTTAYGNSTPGQAVNTVGAFSYELSGLSPSTQYNYRAKAVVGGVTVTGANVSFTTTARPPVVSASSTPVGGSLTTSSARLQGNLEDMAGAQTVQVCFEYGTSTAYGSSTPLQSRTTGGIFFADLTGLNAGTTYHYRAKAIAGSAVGYSSSYTFTTHTPDPGMKVKAVARSGNQPVVAVTPGGQFDLVVEFDINKVSRGAQVALKFDPNAVQCDGVEEGTFFRSWASSNGASVLKYPVEQIDNTAGTVSDVGLVLTGGSGGPVGTGSFIVYRMKTKSSFNGSTTLTLLNVVVSDAAGNSYPGVVVSNCEIVVGTASPPQVTTLAVPASSLTSSSAELRGNLTSLGTASSCQVNFEYGTSASYGSSTTAMNKTETGPFAYNLTGLAPNTTYHFRAKATSAHGTGYGENQTFTTLVNTTGPSVTTGAATAVTATGATLNGSLTDMGGASAVTVSFVWGSDSSNLSNSTPDQSMTAPGPFTANLTGLTEGTTYYFKAKAVGNNTTVYGTVMSFTASSGQRAQGNAPVSTTGEATGITDKSATLNGRLESMGGASSVLVSFEWGTTNAYGNTTEPQTMTAPGPFSASLSGLTPGTTYHYRTKVSAGNRTGYGANKTFTTSGSKSSLGVTLRSSATTVKAGVQFDVTAVVSTDSPVRGAQCVLNFDPALVEVKEVVEGSFFRQWALGKGGSTVLFPKGQIDNNKGVVGATGVAVTGGGAGGPTGEGDFLIFRIVAKDKASGKAKFTLSEVTLTSATGGLLPGVSAGTLEITIESAPADKPVLATQKTDVSQEAPGGVAGAGNEKKPEPMIVDISGYIRSDGVILENLRQDGIEILGNRVTARIDFLKGTVALDGNRSPLKSVLVSPIVGELPGLLAGESLGVGLDLGPGGATFNPPIILAIKYDPSLVPANVSHRDLVIGYFDESLSKWVVLESTVDTAALTVAASVPHFTKFAVLVRPRGDVLGIAASYADKFFRDFTRGVGGNPLVSGGILAGILVLLVTIIALAASPRPSRRVAADYSHVYSYGGHKNRAAHAERQVVYVSQGEKSGATLPRGSVWSGRTRIEINRGKVKVTGDNSACVNVEIYTDDPNDPNAPFYVTLEPGSAVPADAIAEAIATEISNRGKEKEKNK